MMKKTIYLSLLLIFYSCNQSSKLELVLQEAGENRAELEFVLEHYKGDSLKYKAACFLIENMPDKFSIIPENSNDEYKKFLSNIPKEDHISWEWEYSVIAQKLDSISIYQPPMERKEKDILNISSEYLIDNIEEAFKVWNPEYYSFEDFCNYILPYRAGNEPLSYWRKDAKKIYGYLMDSVFTPKELAFRIMQSKKVLYNVGMTKYPYPRTYQEMLDSQWGTCEDMADFMILTLRAIGIPCTMDYVPAWANRNSSHCWNVVKNINGKWEDVGYNMDGANSVVYKVSKIYRRKFNRYINNDVTGEYNMPQSTLQIPLSEVQQGEYAMLATFNNKGWVPVAYAKMDKNGVTFRNLGRGILWDGNETKSCMNEGKGIVYLPLSKEKTPLSYPVIIYEDGTEEYLDIDMEKTETVIIHQKLPVYGIDTHSDNGIVEGHKYELLYWNNKWESLSRQVAEADSLIFQNVPEGALLLLHDYNQKGAGRIFTYDAGTQIW